MQVWKQLRVAVLVVALAGLGWVLHLRGNPLGLGGRPAAIEAAYVTEEAWVVTEILHALTELAGPAGAGQRFSPPRTTAPDHVYDLDGGGLRVDLGPALWAPDAFAPAAEAALAGATPVSSTTPLDVYRQLATRPGPEPIVAAAALADARLARSPADAAAHEAAALAIGAFALRESAGLYYSDVRHALSRMTAHLAFSRAARRGAVPSTDGAVAEALLFTLANHQARALTSLAALPGPGDAERRAWTIALRLRLTDDWRLLDRPAAATPLEKVQYFRARRIVLPGFSGDEELSRLGVELADDVDWARIGRSYSKSVADAGAFVVDGLDAELTEVGRVRRALGYADPASQGAAIAALDDHDPPPGVAAPVVLPWPTWAAQIQRHLATYTAEVDRYYRHRIGGTETADAAKREVDAAIGRLRLFPLGALGRTAGHRGGLGDFEYIREGIALAAGSPETMQYSQWTYLDVASQYEAVAQRMPVSTAWFSAAAARMPYEADVRAAGATQADPSTLAALAQEAPFDVAIANAALRAAHGTGAPVAEIERRFGARLAYDVRALSHAVTLSDGEARVGYQTRACGLAPRECVDLGALHLSTGREAEAAQAYARAFADPDYDTVSLANNCPWLVDYYERTGQPELALALAERAAGSGALLGLQAVSRVYERRGRFDDAEQAAQHASGYESSGDLFGFYYRAVNVHGRTSYRARLDALVHDVFPAGMQAVPSTLAAPPTSGVFIYKDSEFSRRHGVQAGDVIIGIEGWRVDDQRQYRAASATASTNVMKLTLWRGRVIAVELTAPGRLMGVEFRNHPMKGWTD